jgi:anti-sigma-K factor RskA
MTQRPDFRELVGDVSPEERARLERVHDLLVTAGPPPELPPALAELGAEPRDNVVSFLPRRRAGLMLGIAAAIALTTFVGGFIAGRTEDSFQENFQVKMHGVPQAKAASATIHVGEIDGAGNWPLKVVVHGLKPLPKGQHYEMFLTRGTNLRAASCGTFRVAAGSDEVRLNAPYGLGTFDGWVVTIERPGSSRHPVVLTT